MGPQRESRLAEQRRLRRLRAWRRAIMKVHFSSKHFELGISVCL